MVSLDKLLRFQPILARYEQGLVYHTKNLKPEFEDELFAFPESAFKDQCDALGIAYSCCPSPGAGSNIASSGALRGDYNMDRAVTFEEDFEGIGLFGDED